MTAVALAAVLVPKPVPSRFWITVAVCAVLPDVDAIGRPFGWGDLEFLGGHRAFSHSLVFAASVSLVVVAFLLPSRSGSGALAQLWLVVTLAIASHGALDALTTYGSGVEFLAPFSAVRYRATWQVLGGDIARDTVTFLLAFFAARMVLKRRDLPAPRFLRFPESRAGPG